MIASDEDFDLGDEDDDFELMDEEKEEELEEELEEEEREEEEEEEELISYSDESDSPKPPKKPKQPKAPKPKPIKNETPVVDIASMSRKRRVFTAELLASSPASDADSAVCALCHKPAAAIEGGFVSSHPFVEKSGRVFVHSACALNSLDVARSATTFFNVIKTVNRGKKARCTRCGGYGASLSCSVAGCSQYA